MGKETASVNFAFGISDKKFNFFDNDFIEPIMYRLENPGEILSINPEDELVKCTHEDLRRIVLHEWQTRWYPNSLCFKDRSKVGIRGNWYADQASFPVFSIAQCNNKTR